MGTPENEAPIRVNFGAGLHVAAGQRVDDAAYYQYVGRWSRLFVPARRGVDALPAARGPPWHRLVSSNDFASGGPGAFRSFMFAKEGDSIWLRNYSLLCSRSSSRSRG
jgi:hypothetical protein